MKKIFIILSIILLQGCATTSGPSGSGLIGNNINTNYSLEDLRKANWYMNYYLEKLDADQSVLDLKNR